MAKKKELNEEALAICDALKVALSLDKDARCATHNGQLVSATPVGTVYTPFPLELGEAFAAKDLFNALNGCDAPYTVSEDRTKNEIKVSWGRRRATLKTMSKATVYVPPIDHVQNAQISEGFKDELHDFVYDLSPRANDVASSILVFDGYEAYWTNRVIAAKHLMGTWLPNIMVFVNDLKVVTSVDGKINGIGGTAHSITFHYDTGVALKITLADDSSVNYPLGAVKALFKSDILNSGYPVTTHFLEGLNYVNKFTDDVIHVSPEHIGTDADPSVGTSVEQSDIPLTLMFFAATIRLGAFKGADEIIKAADASSAIGFYTSKKNSKFVFVKVKGHEK